MCGQDERKKKNFSFSSLLPHQTQGYGRVGQTLVLAPVPCTPGPSRNGGEGRGLIRRGGSISGIPVEFLWCNDTLRSRLSLSR